MVLVKLIDLFVGVVIFLFVDKRRHNPSIPLALGSIGTFTLITAMLISIGIPRVWYYARTDACAAELANAAGLSSGEPVYVAGVPAGRVENVELAGDHVRVAFRLDNGQALGNQTTATVRLRTVLGKRFLDVMPAGTVDPHSATLIPLSRTTVPYSFDDVGRKAEESASGVEQRTLAETMRTLIASMPGDNEELGAALAGIGAASAGFARNGDKVDQMLRVFRSLSELLTRQTDTLADTAGNAAHIVAALAARREALTRIAANLRAVLAQPPTVYTAKQSDFQALTAGLTRVTGTLKSNADKIDAILLKMPPAIRAVVNATGTGNWADVNSPSLVMPDNLLCALNIQRECR